MRMERSLAFLRPPVFRQRVLPGTSYGAGGPYSYTLNTYMITTIAYVGALTVAAAIFCFGIVCPERLARRRKRDTRPKAPPAGKRLRTMPYINGH